MIVAASPQPGHTVFDGIVQVIEPGHAAERRGGGHHCAGRWASPTNVQRFSKIGRPWCDLKAFRGWDEIIGVLPASSSKSGLAAICYKIFRKKEIPLIGINRVGHFIVQVEGVIHPLLF